MLHLDVVICTHNRAASLATVLSRLALQQPADRMTWSILVVDNASSDNSLAVAETYAQSLSVELRCVSEPVLGLTHARRRGVLETTGDWVAFVDDDNFLEPGWVEAIIDGICMWPDAGGIGGRVRLRWETEPVSAVADFGFCFAEQDHGDEPIELESLVGAGMVLKREALIRSGWLDKPLLDDRVGVKLLSGGDVEMALRVRAAGYSLYYQPSALMEHNMPSHRATALYLFRINRALGVTSATVSLLGWTDLFTDWQLSAATDGKRRMRSGIAGLWWSLRTGRGRIAAMAWLAFAVGFKEGIAQIERMTSLRRSELMGSAALRPSKPAGRQT